MFKLKALTEIPDEHAVKKLFDEMDNVKVDGQESRAERNGPCGKGLDESTAFPNLVLKSERKST